MNSTDRADALPRPSGFSSVNPLPGGGAPIERRQIHRRPHLIHSNNLLRLQRGELLGVGSPLPLDTFLFLLRIVEGLFFLRWQKGLAGGLKGTANERIQ